MNYEYEEMKELTVFAGIESKKDMDWLFKCVDAKLERYQKGDVIASAGAALYSAGLLVSGVAVDSDGKRVEKGSFLFLNYESGKSAPAEKTVTAEDGCSVLWMRWIRLMKLCNFDCPFHKSVIGSVQLQREG